MRRIRNFILTVMFGVLLTGLLAGLSNYSLQAESPEAPPLQPAPVWKALLLVYRNINTTYLDENGITQQLTTSLSAQETASALRSFRQYPSIAHDFSNEEAIVEYDIIYIDRPINSLTSLGSSGYWVSPTDTAPELDQYAPDGTYDSILVHWAQCNPTFSQCIPSPGWGLGLVATSGANGATYATVANASDGAWNTPTVGEPWLHEWLHGVTPFYESMGYPMPEGGADGGGLHGYTWSPTTGWGDYYRDLMTGQVLDDGALTGITPSAWQEGTILQEEAPVYTDFFYENTLNNYQRVGNMSWDSTREAVKFTQSPPSQDNQLLAPLDISTSFTVKGRVHIPSSNLGPFDSIAIALSNGSVRFWGILAYGPNLVEKNHISILRNGFWGELYPLTLDSGWYTVKMQVDQSANLIRLKAWADGDDEPNWQTGRTLDNGWVATSVGFRHFGDATTWGDDLLVIGEGGGGVGSGNLYLPLISNSSGAPPATATPTVPPPATATPTGGCVPPNLRIRPATTLLPDMVNDESFDLESLLFNYGRHYPYASRAVTYINGTNGTWKEMNPAEYQWNYYDYPDNPPNHPFNRDCLIPYANGSHFTTARDADGHLLLDWNHDGEIDTNYGGFAFHEHSGKGESGQQQRTTFTHFWFDDNWLARYMNAAYGYPLPNGLSDYTDRTRWRLIGGDTQYWVLYPHDEDYVDQLVLNGLYYLAQGNINAALSKWDRIKTISNFYYNSSNQRYVYPNIDENYHYGLFQIFTSFLMDHPSVPSYKRHELMQHWVSIRSNIISYQEENSSGPIGWRTSNAPCTSNNCPLINTETVAANVLGLGSGAKFTFEAGLYPLSMTNNNYFLRPHNVLSAVVGASNPGHMTYGPGWQLPAGSYEVDFFLRSPAPTGNIATIDVYNGASSQILDSQVINTMASNNEWSRYTLNFSVSGANNIEYRVYWHGNSNLDVAAIRVR